ncbi:MAG: MCE family protein [Pseudomonadales bacterium]|nr:MCE family protein [Pseudomonadales bacterium]
MNEQNTPQISPKAGLSIIWLIPLVTAVLGIWLITRTLMDQAPIATISFKTADGIEAGKTRIKYKSVDIGLVDKIEFAEGFKNVVLTVSFNHSVEAFLRRDTRFWVVRPQLSLRGVTGLSTLISGAYIEIDPGPGSSQDHFVGLEQIPLITRDDTGTRITLAAENLGSLGTGSPIYYQGLLAGEVLGHELSSDSQSIYVHAFIRAPYNQLVKGSSRFWNVSGMDVSLDANGIEIKTASMQALMIGGIAFESPEALSPGGTNIENLIYTLYASHQQIEQQVYTRKQQFVMYFTSSVRGLSPGAPLEFKGIRIGSVIDIRLEFNRDNTSFKIPVLVEIEPERIIDREIVGADSPLATLQTLIDRGLRARLATGSLLTGQLFVELNMYPGVAAQYMGDVASTVPELPTIAGAIEALTQSVQGFITKLDEVNIQQMSSSVLGILDGANELLNKPESEATVTDLEASMRSLKQILKRVDDANLEQTIGGANNVLVNLDKTLGLLDGLLDPNSPLQYNLIQVTGELEEMAISVRALVETLERRPQSLIFGREKSPADGEMDE